MEAGINGRTRCLAVIPARWGSTRLPGKPLKSLGGLPMVEHVRRRVSHARGIDRVVVATDDERIAECIRQHGGEVMMTEPCGSGTERVWQVSRQIPSDYVINIQGDMPLVNPVHIEKIIALLDKGPELVTLATPIHKPEMALQPHFVKVVLDQDENALYFSRASIPTGGPWLLHLGVYGFTREAVNRFCGLANGILAPAEDLEQLRWLEAGHSIRVGCVEHAEPCVDTPKQLECMIKRFESRELSIPLNSYKETAN